MLKFVYSLLILLSFHCHSNETTLTIDKAVSNDFKLSFPNDKNTKAKLSDFELVNYVVMSNLLGERWAVITLTNTSSGNRILEHNHLLALFADGSRHSPSELKLNFEGNETQSITVSFGENKFPILSIMTEVDK